MRTRPAGADGVRGLFFAFFESVLFRVDGAVMMDVCG